MRSYNHKKIEAKWQKVWEKNDFFQARDSSTRTGQVKEKPKYYCLIEFPYPSGDGLHVGHVRSYAGMDVIARKKRMEGFNVLYPIGWDAFGLPTENFAIKTGKHPTIITKENVKIFKKQMQSLGISFDWSREINTTDPNYYKWTQWIFLQLFKHGLAYKKKMPINWCPSCKIGLANEEVIDGKCERCGAETEQKELEQWMLKITAYADRLIEDLETVDYLEQIKTQQINWIGRSYGAEIDFKIKGTDKNIRVFTTRPDTIFGATFLVLSPEHELVEKVTAEEQREEVLKYLERVKILKQVQDDTKRRVQDDDRRAGLTRDDKREKTGVFTGAYAVNPATGKEISIWIADYVSSDYGTGAIMAVPAHDERDFEFAIKYEKYGLEIKKVVNPGVSRLLDLSRANIENIEKVVEKHKKFGVRLINKDGEYSLWAEDIDLLVKPFEELNQKSGDSYKDDIAEYLRKVEYTKNEAYSGDGVMINSGEYNGLLNIEAAPRIISKLEEQDAGKKMTQYHLRDWVFSRQHYWGEPIPMVNCEQCGLRLGSGQGWQAIDEKDLPLELPFVKKYEPTGTGESPLAAVEKWVKTKCPKCGGEARRETDTMPNWAGSSWYFLRYIDPNNDEKFADFEKLRYWLPVDLYNGGMEHTTLHLLYSRFWHKFLYDIGVVPTSEPYQKRVSHGMILAPDGQKMSKSRGNVINPDSIVAEYGADTLRVYEMFIGPYDQAVSWDINGLIGARRFLERIYNFNKWRDEDGQEVSVLLHKTIKKVGDDIEKLRFNTAISALMIFLNKIQETGCSRETFKKFILLSSVFVSHLAEEIWNKLGETTSVVLQKWPEYDANLIAQEEIELPVQINGKVRDKINVSPMISEKELRQLVFARGNVQKYLQDKKIKRFIYIQKKMVSIVV